jgi:hypothetical protein
MKVFNLRLPFVIALKVCGCSPIDKAKGLL